MAVCRVRGLRLVVLPLQSIHQRAAARSVQQADDPLLATRTTVLLQKTGHRRKSDHASVRTDYHRQPRKRGSLKRQEPAVPVNLPCSSSWLSSTCTGTGTATLQSRSADIWFGRRLQNIYLPGEKSRSDGVQNIRSLHTSVRMTHSNHAGTFSGTASDGLAGSRRSNPFGSPRPLARRHISLFGVPEGSAWSRAIAEAEKIVGYPTSFIGLRCLLSDELSNIAMQVRKLVGTKHPLVKTARGFIYDGKHNIQTRGLIILLIAKAAGPSPKDGNRQSMVRGIYPSQRTLAEIAEMIHTAFLVHKGVVNIRDLLPSDGPRSVMEFGNKMAVLSGDFLLASACKGLAELRNTLVVDLISQSISDLTEAAFMPSFSEEEVGVNRASPPPPPRPVGMADWAQYAYLSSGSLVGKGCRAALALAGHGEEMQARAFEFGKNISLAQQLHQELQTFTSGSSSEFSLTLAPVLLHLEGSGDQDRVRNRTKADIKKLHREIKSGSALRKSRELRGAYAESARLAIADFPQSDAKDALLNMVKAVS